MPERARPQTRVSFQTSPLYESSASAGWTPLRIETARYLTFPASINGAAVEAVIDTGASLSVARRSLVNDLRLEQCGTTSATLFTTELTVPLFRVSRIRVGEVSARNLKVACHDVSALEQALSEDIHLLIGQDVLRRSVLDLQLTRNRGRITSAFRPDGEIPYEKVNLVHGTSGLPGIIVQPESESPVRAIIDLGSNIVCSLSEDYAKSVGLLDRPSSSTLTAGLEGFGAGRMITLRSLRIGRFELTAVPACIMVGWKFDAPINIGWPAFRAFDLVFAFNRDLWLRADADIAAIPLPRDRSGIGAIRLDNHLLVRHVADDSPAARAGLAAGDKIVAIDGRTIDASHPAPGVRHGNRPAGTKLDLMLAGGTSIMMTLEDYF